MSNFERVLVTGTNRGIGLGIVQQYLKRDAVNIFATCRDIDTADELRSLADANPNKLVLVELDLADADSISRSYEKVRQSVDGLDVLINNAAMRFPDAQELFGAVKADEFLHSMNVNAVGPFMMVQTYIDLLKAGNKPRIVNVTTGPLVPVEYNLPYNYCISKAALNMMTRYFAVNFAEFGVISVGLYPGWVQTEMGTSGGGKPPLTIEESSEGIVDTVSKLEVKDNEQFIDWLGRVRSRLYW